MNVIGPQLLILESDLSFFKKVGVHDVLASFQSLTGACAQYCWHSRTYSNQARDVFHSI